MATIIIRPTSFVGGTQYTSYTGPTSNADFASKLGDNSDLTFSSLATGAGGQYRTQFGLGTPTIASGDFVARVGHSIRWKGGGDNGLGSPATEYLGTLTYRSIDTTPSSTPTFYPDGRATATSTEVGVLPVTWSNTDCNNLRILLNNNRQNAAYLNTTTHYDIWATLYTLATPTCTVGAQTFNNGTTKPNITVSVTGTIGWEASAADSTNLRKITTEIRIESGGSGVGTGTLVATGSIDTTYTATATQSISVPTNADIANGTYNIYARGSRWRESQTTQLSDQFGSWSAAATLTMSNPVPTAPTVTLTTDQTNDLITIAVTPIATAGFSSPIIQIQRSADGGTTWTTIRGSGVSGTFGSATNILDYESPRNTTVSYRARINATYTGGYVASGAYTTSSTTSININQDWNIKVPTSPSLNILDANIIDKPQDTINEDLGVFRPIDRRYPIVVAGSLTGWDGSLTIITTTAAQWTALKSVLECQAVLYLEGPFIGAGKYIRIISGARVELMGTLSAPLRRISVEYVEVQTP